MGSRSSETTLKPCTKLGERSALARRGRKGYELGLALCAADASTARIETNLYGGMAPPITYMVDGKQYVTLMGGTGKVVSPFAKAGGGGREAPVARPEKSAPAD